jgi:hypothetical protein
MTFPLRNDACEEFEKEEQRPANGQGTAEKPEVRRGPFLEEAADPANQCVGAEEREIIKADDRSVDCFSAGC